MGKLTLLSVILFSVIVPIAAANTSQPQRKLRTIQYLTVGMVLLWGYLCLTYYPTVTAIE